MSCDVSTYECSDKGLILPLVSEYSWSVGARATIYLLGLLWSFMAISIIADVFMQAIEKITSRTQEIKIPDPETENEYTTVNVKLWNGTVANLTLMALGSSAPEILMSIILIVGNGFQAESLGPSTIVGSAAFNLMCITGICVISIPLPEIRVIKHIKVFALTSSFSIFAYVWLILILVVITPDFIDLWEAVITLLLFPVLVILAYLADKDYCGKRKVQDEEGALMAGNLLDKNSADKEVIVEMIRKMKGHPEADEKDIAMLTAHLMEQNRPHDRGWYRINAIRNLTGSTPLNTALNEKSLELLEDMLIDEQAGVDDDDFFELSDGGKKSIVEFEAPCTAVLERDGKASINIMRHGNLKQRVIFKVETFDGTAEAEADYKTLKETMVFEPGETCKSIDIEIIDDNVWEPDEVFFVRISVEPRQAAAVGRRAITQVLILNDDEPGTFEFGKPSFMFKESIGTAMIPVERKDGVDGNIDLKWQTKDITAICGRDYENSSGELTFKHGEVTKMIEIQIKDDLEFEKDENFEIDLIQVNGGAKIGKLRRCVVTIVNDDEFDGLVSRIADLTNANLDALRVSKQTWGKQFEEAMNVNGGDIETATFFAYVMHFMTFGFKVIFACVPPPSIWGGWLCFVVALIVIGVITAFVSDLASIFGCLIGLDESVVAITLVALGTSLPDLFASRQAALMEKYADNSVGNVTGSNSVNVFLGLGLAWFVAALYWTVQGKSFEVPAGNLGFSVVLYTLTAILTLTLLIIRRNLSVFGKAELGGPKFWKIFSGFFMIGLWILYVILSSLQVYEYIPGF